MIFNDGFYRIRTLIVCNEKGEEIEVKIDAQPLSFAEDKALEKAKREGKIKGNLYIKNSKKEG